MGKSRAQRRTARGKIINLFFTNTTLGWRVASHVPVELAVEKIALRQWREVFFEDGSLAGVQPLKPPEGKALSEVLIERLIAVTITLPEIKRNAGLYGRSHTIGMPEWKRLRRHARLDDQKILPPEDAIERAIEKVKQWPYPASRIGTDEKGAPVFGDRAVRVYPKAPAERRAGRKA
jgi:predicted alpha/beta hydrolase